MLIVKASDKSQDDVFSTASLLSGHRLIKITALAACLSACANTPSVKTTASINGQGAAIHALGQNSAQRPAFNDSLFALKEVIEVDRITQLSADQKNEFLTFYNDPKFALTPPHTRLASYLGLLVDQLRYSEKTYTAQQTLSNLTGNCLSLTILTTALADLVDVEIHYQLLDQNPVFSIKDNLLVTSDHLRAVLKSSPTATKSGEMQSISYIRIDYFNTNGLSFVDSISVNTQRSLFYSNLSIEHLSNNDLDSSYAYAKKALEVDPANASALNTVAILHRKRGDSVVAEKLYEFGALNYAKAPVFLRNYKSLLTSQGREINLNSFLVAQDKAAQTHPWEWVRAGKAAFSRGDYNDAVSYYQKALEITPDIPEVHVFAGQASYAAGNEFQSKRFFVNAFKLSKDSDDQQFYKGKLLALKSRLNQ